jgi:hypothetical protein
MKFRIETLVDFGTLVPTQAELKPHDYPLEIWASSAFNDIISIAQGALHRQRIDTERDRDVLPAPMYEALVRSIELRLAVVEQIGANLFVEPYAEQTTESD